jgi:hypothetical protein
MRVALISFCPGADRKAMTVVKNLENASASRGNRVELLNGFENLTNTRLTAFDYIAVFVQVKGLFASKIPSRVSEYLATSGSINGKKGCALVLKSGLSSEKTCRNLMQAMEREGLKLDYFEVIDNAEHALSAGTKIG